MKKIAKYILAISLIAIIIAASRVALAQETIHLWPEEKLPNSKGLALEDSVHNDRVYQIKYPEMYPFIPAPEENTGGAVLIFPGGGYHHLTYNLGGFQLAKWFNTIGVSAFVVNYRLPNSPDLKKLQITPLQDAQRAMRIVRARAEEWQVDPDKIGVLGTSSGGHVASTIGTHREDISAIGDSLDHYSYKPDFMIMISPVITLGKYTHEGSRKNLLGLNPSKSLVQKYSNELQVTKNTPPAFLIHAANDRAVPPQNSLQFYEALLDSGVTRSSLHIFPRGGHEIGLVGNPGSSMQWTDLCKAWLNELDFIE